MKQIHVEASTYCNARCPLCPRSLYGYKVEGVYPEIHLNLDKFKECLAQFPEREYVYFNGHLGDPMMNPDIVELATITECRTSVTTNGSIGSRETWEALAKNNIIGRFSIDGLEDTNHIYRQDVQWNKIMDRAKWFIDAGGYATWKWIPFLHNKHQEEEVKKLANEMGFTTIIIRNNRDPDLDKMSSRADTSDKPWYTIKQQHTSTVGKTDYTSKEIFVEFSNQLERKNFKEPYNIDCIWHDDRKIYISYDGTVWPCCYIAFDSLRSPRFIELQKLKFAQYGENFNNLYHYSIDKIMIKEPFYSDMLNSIADDKKHGFNKLDSYFTCIKTCSKRGYELKPNHLQAHKIYNG